MTRGPRATPPARLTRALLVTATRQAIVGVFTDQVVHFPALAVRINTHHRAAQVWQVMISGD